MERTKHHPRKASAILTLTLLVILSFTASPAQAKDYETKIARYHHKNVTKDLDKFVHLSSQDRLFIIFRAKVKDLNKKHGYSTAESNGIELRFTESAVKWLEHSSKIREANWLFKAEIKRKTNGDKFILMEHGVKREDYYKISYDKKNKQ